VTETKRTMRMKGKVTTQAPLGRGSAEFTRGETELGRQSDHVRVAQLSVNREAPERVTGVDGGADGASSVIPRQLAAG
jgi:hypothetical protein